MKPFEVGNPIFTRESRTRFRSWRTFALLLLYAALLATATALMYGQTFGATVQVGYARHLPTPDILGRALFFQLATMQLFGWMLLAPALAATTISGERERGLLEAVQLSHLTPRQIAGGKLAAIFSFIALLFPITLPMLATCFLLGGIAPIELCAAIALQLSTAFLGASLGLFFSSRARRAQASMSSSLLLMGAFAFLTQNAFDEWRSGALMFGTPTEWSGIFWQGLIALGSFSGPQNALGVLQSEYSRGRLVVLPFDWLLDSAPMWIWTCALHVFSGALLLFFATRALRRPLPELTPDDTRWTDFARRALVSRQSKAAAKRAVAAEQAQSRSAAKMADGAARAGEVLLRDLPLHHFVNFRDPLLRREVRGKFRWRRGTVLVALGQLAALLVILSFYVLLVFAVFFPRERAQILGGAFQFLLILSMAACAVMGASTLTRERESGTWEGLQLSLLKPLEIARAKVLAPLIACFYYAMPLWILLPFFVQFSGTASINQNSNGFWNNGVPLSQVLATLCVIALAGLFCSCAGLLFSSLCRRTVAAVGGTLAAVFTFSLVLPEVLTYLHRTFIGRSNTPWVLYIQPLNVLGVMNTADALLILVFYAALNLSLCAIMFFAVTRVLARRGDDQP